MILQMNYRQAFEILEIEPTTNPKEIKKAYARLVKEFHPEEHPEKWQRIHDAYECAMKYTGCRRDTIVMSMTEELVKKEPIAKRIPELENEEPEFAFKDLTGIAQQKRLKQAEEYKNTLTQALEILSRQCQRKFQRKEQWKSVLSRAEIQMVRTSDDFLNSLGELLSNKCISLGCYRIIKEFLENVHQELIGNIIDEEINKNNLNAWERASEGLKHALFINVDKFGFLCGVVVFIFMVSFMTINGLISDEPQSITSRESDGETGYALIYAERYKDTKRLDVGDDSVLPEGTALPDWDIKKLPVPDTVWEMAEIKSEEQVVNSFVVTHMYGTDSEADVVFPLQDFGLEEGLYEVWQYDGEKYCCMTIHTSEEWSVESDMVYPYVENNLLYINMGVSEHWTYSEDYPVVIVRKDNSK